MARTIQCTYLKKEGEGLDFAPYPGELGKRNGVYATNVEHKMGLKVSTTCEMTFGGDEPAIGWLVGDVHDCIAQMFKVIEDEIGRAHV